MVLIAAISARRAYRRDPSGLRWQTWIIYWLAPGGVCCGARRTRVGSSTYICAVCGKKRTYASSHGV
jgi:hypothetical protein